MGELRAPVDGVIGFEGEGGDVIVLRLPTGTRLIDTTLAVIPRPYALSPSSIPLPEKFGTRSGAKSTEPCEFIRR
jgi:hypothetical protein